jgi:hypothetical protein
MAGQFIVSRALRRGEVIEQEKFVVGLPDAKESTVASTAAIY